MLLIISHGKIFKLKENKIMVVKIREDKVKDETLVPIKEVDLYEKMEEKPALQLQKFARYMKSMFRKIHELDSEMDILYEMIEGELEDEDEDLDEDEYYLPAKSHYNYRPPIKRNPVVLGEFNSDMYIVHFGKGRQGKIKKIYKKRRSYEMTLKIEKKLFVEFLEQWRYFLKEKKEEIH